MHKFIVERREAQVMRRRVGSLASWSCVANGARTKERADNEETHVLRTRLELILASTRVATRVLEVANGRSCDSRDARIGLPSPRRRDYRPVACSLICTPPRTLPNEPMPRRPTYQRYCADALAGAAIPVALVNRVASGARSSEAVRPNAKGNSHFHRR